jgi:flagellar motor protein MotB
MAVTLIAVTKNVTAEEEAKIRREKDIKEVMSLIKRESFKRNVQVDDVTYKIDLGKVVGFDSGSYAIKPESARFLRDYIPVLLQAKNSPEGQKWMRRIVVEGYTDTDGTYLYNLRLSQDRSRSVVCELFAVPTTGETPLSEAQLRQIQDLFLVGGYSFNTSVVQDKAAARKVELKIEFWGQDEARPQKNDQLHVKEFGKC